jgi:predicted nucleic acid-binding protein
VRAALDTNILAYAEGVNGSERKRRALRVIRGLGIGTAVLPVQVLGELFNVLVRKAGRRPQRARAAVLAWRDAFPLIDTSAAVLMGAADLATDHGLNIWDAIILAAAAESDCRLLLSEDLQDGFTWKGVTVANPFSSPLHPLVDGLLAEKNK